MKIHIQLHMGEFIRKMLGFRKKPTWAVHRYTHCVLVSPMTISVCDPVFINMKLKRDKMDKLMIVVMLKYMFLFCH